MSLAWMVSPLAAAESLCVDSAHAHPNANKTAAWNENTTVAWDEPVRLYEYSSNANPRMTEVPIRVFPPTMHQVGPSRVMPFDLSGELECDYPATTPNLLANFVRIVENEQHETGVSLAATSQTFYVIRGEGRSRTRNGTVGWGPGDMFVLPYLGDEADPVCTNAGAQCVVHSCVNEPAFGGCALYWVHDEPMLQYLGVRPSKQVRFEPAFYSAGAMSETVQSISNIAPDGSSKNRRGILLGNAATLQTRTLTPTLWSLLNTIGPKSDQKPHKHNSVALDLAVVGSAEGGKPVYTRMGREIDSNGVVTEPVVARWETGGVFVTPPGWWHSHHNEGDEDAWVLPIQDAGIYTHQRTLDIRFADEEVARLHAGRSRGATIDVGTTMSSENLYHGLQHLKAGAMTIGSP